MNPGKDVRVAADGCRMIGKRVAGAVPKQGGMRLSGAAAGHADAMCQTGPGVGIWR